MHVVDFFSQVRLGNVVHAATRCLGSGPSVNADILVSLPVAL